MVLTDTNKHTWEEYILMGMEAREGNDNSAWKLGDLANNLVTDYGADSIGKYAYAIGVVKKTLMNYRTVASKFNPETRNTYRKLSFSHFKTVASLDKPEVWLEKADNHKWNVEQLSIEVKKAYQDSKNKQIDDKPPKVFRCPECGLWRLENISNYEICKGHYVLEKGKVNYK